MEAGSACVSFCITPAALWRRSISILLGKPGAVLMPQSMQAQLSGVRPLKSKRSRACLIAAASRCLPRRHRPVVFGPLLGGDVRLAALERPPQMRIFDVFLTDGRGVASASPL